MKKQQCQWLFKVFSKTLNPLFINYYSYNNNACRPFCSTTTNTSNLHMLLEKKLPLLIVPYHHFTKKKIASFFHKGGEEVTPLGSLQCVCDGTIGFISLFHGDGDELKKKNKEVEVYKVYLPEMADRKIIGSSEGWLVTVHKNSEIQLLNPMSKVKVHLPPFTALPGVVGKFVSEEILVGTHLPKDEAFRGLCYLKNNGGPRYQIVGSPRLRDNILCKVVTNTTTTDATNSTTVVMAIYNSRRLAFCRSPTTGNGNGIDDGTDEPKRRWIDIPCLEGEEDCRHVWVDVTFYKGNFYAVSIAGHVGVVKGLDGISPFVKVIVQKPEVIIQKPEYYEGCAYHVYKENYLVDSSSSSSGGDLLIVMRTIISPEEEETTEVKEFPGNPYETIRFRVFKLDFNGPSWEEVTNLGEDCALFIGYNRSFSFSTSKFPGCRGNCIYFTDNSGMNIINNSIGGQDMGLYNLEDGSFETLYETSCSQLFMPPPIWYVPN